jgi:hypoxanthine-guanine phosphoribosyltransferase
MTTLITEFATHKPKKIVSATLLSRSSARATYTGFVVKSDAYIIGYGLDSNNYQRNLPELYIM